jgi:Domain of unknown function (DUF4440)
MKSENRFKSLACRIRPKVAFGGLVLVALCASSQARTSIPAPNPSAPPRHDSAVIAQVENQWLDAIVQHDVGTIDKILGDDFVRPAPQSGRYINKAELLRYYRSQAGRPATDSKHIEGLQVLFYGPTAIARGSVVSTDAQEHEISRLLFTDVFVWRAGTWIAVSAQENAVTAKN